MFGIISKAFNNKFDKFKKERDRRIRRIVNGVYDVGKGALQIGAFFIGPIGGALYGVLAGMQMAQNKRIKFDKHPLKYLGTLLSSAAVGAGLCTVPLIGPLLLGPANVLGEVGMYGDYFNREEGSQLSRWDRFRKTMEVSVLGALPFLGPIWAGQECTRSRENARPTKTQGTRKDKEGERQAADERKLEEGRGVHTGRAAPAPQSREHDGAGRENNPFTRREEVARPKQKRDRARDRRHRDDTAPPEQEPEVANPFEDHGDNFERWSAHERRLGDQEHSKQEEDRRKERDMSQQRGVK